MVLKVLGALMSFALLVDAGFWLDLTNETDVQKRGVIAGQDSDAYNDQGRIYIGRTFLNYHAEPGKLKFTGIGAVLFYSQWSHEYGSQYGIQFYAKNPSYYYDWKHSCNGSIVKHAVEVLRGDEMVYIGRAFVVHDSYVMTQVGKVFLVKPKNKFFYGWAGLERTSDCYEVLRGIPKTKENLAQLRSDLAVCRKKTSDCS